MRADIHDGPEHNALQAEAGYIDARPYLPDRRNLLQRAAGPYIGSRAVRLSLTLADLGRVRESILHAAPDMGWNFYTVSAWPGHERNLMRPYFASNCGDGIAEGENRF